MSGTIRAESSAVVVRPTFLAGVESFSAGLQDRWSVHLMHAGSGAPARTAFNRRADSLILDSRELRRDKKSTYLYGLTRRLPGVSGRSGPRYDRCWVIVVLGMDLTTRRWHRVTLVARERRISVSRRARFLVMFTRNRVPLR